MNNNDGQSEFKSWYNLIKDKSPMGAVGFAAISTGLLLLILSSSMTGRVSDAVYYTGCGLCCMGLLAFFSGLVVMAIKQLNTK
ncbi:hypothetical protein [Mucilaginibacter pedocola]|uniref:Uncharacterized protein n=1 Tax=Mucilaginibacter pedocola TaxID=1792845 RepID=A0A1S9PA96_9SPHI|nr:hypothetical protein [Mucilaginibacter pedocola]OOQ57865.1 hypothetical protein BC343_13905 [Mucilaginibacter pedocola]